MSYDRFLSAAAREMQQSAIRQMGAVAAHTPGIISFAPGYPAPDTFAWEEYREIAAALLSSRDGGVLQYGPTRGHVPLLETIVGLSEARGIRASLDELSVTTGSQQGLDLVARVFVDPGDVVLMELPSYTGAITAFNNARATLVGVPQDDDGLDVDALEDTVARLRSQRKPVKFLYVVPNFQNPTGRLVSLRRRLEILEAAARLDLLIVEDDPYGALYFEGSATSADTRPIKADDTDGRTIYLSSFSKTLAPAYRVGWLQAPTALSAKMEAAKQAIDLCTGNFDQRVVHEACIRGVLDRQIPRLRRHYQERRDTMERALHVTLGGHATWRTPAGGFFLWVALPAGVSTERLLTRALAQRVVYVAGRAFFVDGSGAETLRLSYSFVDDAQIVEGIARLGVAVSEEMATPAAVAKV